MGKGDRRRPGRRIPDEEWEAIFKAWTGREPGQGPSDRPGDVQPTNRTQEVDKVRKWLTGDPAEPDGGPKP